MALLIKPSRVGGLYTLELRWRIQIGHGNLFPAEVALKYNRRQEPSRIVPAWRHFTCSEQELAGGFTDLLMAWHGV